ncbi:MAG TPA: NAD(P)-dependent oxidoreductase [Candidatus Paceibacterota bacterium]|nr:NAD(P)-dependent oxidoreductase [Candidatus Paceibacterota bacterium]
MRIVFFETMPGEREAYEKLLPEGHELQFHEGKLSSDEDVLALAKDADIISVFVNCEVTRRVIDSLDGLKLIVTRSMGYDHIDVAYAKQRGVRVANVKSYAAHPVAEFAFALLLSVVRNVSTGHRRLRDGTNWDIRDLQGMMLHGKTLGVVGTGRIGRQVCAIARGFGMHVLAFDAFPDENAAKEAGFSYAKLDEVLARADVVTIHVPYMKDTHHLINEEAFGRMKKGVYLINTARGEIVDTHALIAALRNGTVAGAGLDVLEQERALKKEQDLVIRDTKGIDFELLTANHILLDHPKVVVTPHIAFSTADSMTEITKTTAEAINAFIGDTEFPFL